MKKTILALAGITAFTFALVSLSTSGCSSGEPGVNDSVKETPQVGITSSYAFGPADIISQDQAVADTFSWLTFIAMNWPADTNSCGPDTTQSILSGTGPVVWETYLAPEQVFVPDGSLPATWCASGTALNKMNHVPEKVREFGRENGINRFIFMTSKSPDGLKEASGGPLVDQNGRFVRYEVRMNFDEYNYITTQNIWNVSGQQQFSDTGGVIKFPVSPMGAMEFKAAWKVIGQGDDASKFYTIQAIVYNDTAGGVSPDPFPVTLGLVGLHIAHKTAHQSNWVWSTFEHVDNLTKSFYNPDCSGCPVNQPITGPTIELNPDGSPIHAPTQVTRVNKVDTSAYVTPYGTFFGDTLVDSINIYFQNLLQGSVWANYELVSTQWLVFEHIFPKFLANSVQETYLQGPTPPSYGNFNLIIDEEYYKDNRYQPFSSGTSASCMGCHYTATTAAGLKSDFSFIIGDAQ
jgi:hypothetical protein